MTELTEKIPCLRTLHFLHQLSFQDFKPFCKSSCKNDAERKENFDRMKNYVNHMISNNGTMVMNYDYSQYSNNDIGGRLYCGKSIQGLSKPVRGFLMKHTTDIDMINCHPVILKYICDKHNIMCPNLEYYIKNRNTILNTVGADYKQKFLCSVNSDKSNTNDKYEFLRNFDKECKTIQKQVTSISEYKHIVDSVPDTKTYNRIGSAINRIICVYENNILQELIKFIQSKNMEISVLAFDGLMVYGDYYGNNDLLREMEQYIENKFEGLNMKFDYKRHNDEIKMPDDFKIPEKEKELAVANGNDYESVKIKFEETHCKIINLCLFVKKFEGRFIFMNKEQLKTSYEHIRYDELVQMKNGTTKIERKKFIPKWLEDENILKKDDFGNYPSDLTCPENIYNLWIPFAMEEIIDYEYNVDAVNMFRKHIRILCGNDEVVADYLEKWIGQMIQFPSVKTICPTFISKEGAGKGTLFHIISKMLGTEKVYETANPSRDVWGDFNSLMTRSFLVILDELSKKDTLESEGKIKALITSPSLTINEKNTKSFTITSYHRFAITTNKEEPISTSKDDRRKLIIRCSDELIKNIDYFTEIRKVFDNVDAIKSCYEYFKSIPDLRNFKNIPMPCTEYQNDLKEENKCPISCWIEDYCSQNFDNKEIIRIKSADVFELFKDWCSTNKMAYDVNNMKFGIRLKRLGVDGIVTGIHTKNGNVMSFDFQKIKTFLGLGCLIDL